MVRNENSSASFLVKDAPHQKRPEVWGMSPSSKCESWKSSGSHHGIMQTAAVTRHRSVDQQFSDRIPVPLGQALAMAPSEMARSNSSPSIRDHALKNRHGGCRGDYKADSSRVTTSRIQVWPWSVWLRSCQYIRTANDGTATGRGRHRNPWVTPNSFATRDGTVTIRSVRAMISGTLVKWGVSRTICRLTPCCTSMSSTIL
jgi:hypothetical protein